MKFNKDQREGLAKVLDNIATAFIVGVAVGALADHKLTALQIYSLLLCSLFMISVATGLRGVKEPENVQ